MLEQNQTEGIKSIPYLIKCREGNYFYYNKGAATIALTHIGKPVVVLLVDAFKDPGPRVAEGAAIALGIIGQKVVKGISVIPTKYMPE